MTDHKLQEVEETKRKKNTSTHLHNSIISNHSNLKGEIFNACACNNNNSSNNNNNNNNNNDNNNYYYNLNCNSSKIITIDNNLMVRINKEDSNRSSKVGGLLQSSYPSNINNSSYYPNTSN